MAAAEPIIREALPDANVPTSVRSTGVPVRYGARSELDAVLEEWLASDDEGTACVVGDPALADGARVRSLSPEHGIESDSCAP